MTSIQRPKLKSQVQSQKIDEGLVTACPVRDAPYGLSDRELAVLYLVTEGLSDKQIALALGVTNYTINKHVGAILTKMEVRSRTAAAVSAIRKHLFDEHGRCIVAGPLGSLPRRYGPAA